MRELERRRHAEPPAARLLDEVAVDVGGRGGGLRRGDVLSEVGDGRLEAPRLQPLQDVERVGRGLAGDEAPHHAPRQRQPLEASTDRRLGGQAEQRVTEHDGDLGSAECRLDARVERVQARV